MQKKSLLYQRQILPALGDYLTLKDLLNTASVSKEHYQLLKEYLHEHYQLTNQQQKNQFQQLKQIFNRKLYVYKKGDQFAKINNSKVLVGDVQTCENCSVVKTIDGEYKLIKTSALIKGENIELMSLPKKYNHVSLSQTGNLYAAEGSKLTRFNTNNPEAFQNGQNINLKGQIQDFACSFRFAIAVVRDSEDCVSLLLFDEKEHIEAFRRIELPFEMNRFKTEGHLVMGRGNCYLLFNQTLYEINVKDCTLTPLPEFVGRSIVKVMGGRNHFMAWERTSKPSETWSTEEVIKFAQSEGFEDYINVFKSEKVTGKVLLDMDKKYMQEVLGIINHKLQQKLKLRIQEKNQQNEEGDIIYGWGRAAEGQLATNPAKQITKPLKLKIPSNCKVFKLAGNFTFLENAKENKLLVNFVDEKTNKLEWHEVTNRKIWNLSVVEDNIILVASAAKQKVPQRESEAPVHEKKDKLRTAKNIIDKITWDERLNSTEFRVGYLDKYDGILEIPFSELEQSEIKEYRIEYFKHNGKVVWDKKKRLDVL